jgi:hypothetical protein
MQFLIGAIILLFSAVCIGVMMGVLAVGVMFAMHKGLDEHLPEKRYNEFDFDQVSLESFQHIDRRVLTDFAARLAIAYVGTTVVVHMLAYLLPRSAIVKHGGLVGLTLLVLETAAVAACLFALFRLDRLRLAILAASSAVIYLFFLWFIFWMGLLL